MRSSPSRPAPRDVLRQLLPRQRAGARAAGARPRRHAAAGLHADAHRRTERQPTARPVRRHQRLPAAALRLFRKTPRFLDRLWDSPSVIRAFASRAVSTDARLLGDLTISMLQGEHGVLRKEFEKLVDWMRDEPLPDVINLPNSLLIAMAAPLQAGAEAAGLLHAAGRGAVSQRPDRRRTASRRSR